MTAPTELDADYCWSTAVLVGATDSEHRQALGRVLAECGELIERRTEKPNDGLWKADALIGAVVALARGLRGEA